MGKRSMLYRKATTLSKDWKLFSRRYVHLLLIVKRACSPRLGFFPQGATTLAWNLAMFLSFWAFGSFLAEIGLVDLGLAIVLIHGIGHQTYYLPFTSSPCDNARKWRNGPNGRNLFYHASRDDGKRTQEEICSTAVANMRMLVAVM
jgi:hypothetical protein